jgi:hypothetical protein
VCWSVWFFLFPPSLAGLRCLLVVAVDCSGDAGGVLPRACVVLGAGGHASHHCNPPQNELSEVDIKTFVTKLRY